MSPTKVAPAIRTNFGKVKHLAATPDLLEIQIQSFKDYFQLETTPDKRNNEGLFKVFKENFPITDARNNFVLEFLDYFIDPPRYSIDECIERGLTYSVPLKAKLKLYCTDPEHEDFETIVATFERNGLAGPLNRYRNFLRDWEDLAAFDELRQPSIFITGERDSTRLWLGEAIERQAQWLPGLTGTHVIPGCGHWVQQERPEEVNALLLEFLAG